MKTERAVPRLALNRSEVALAIGVSTNTVDLMVKEGALPQPRKWHTRKIWIVSEIEAALTEWPTDGLASADEDSWAIDTEWRAESGVKLWGKEPKKAAPISHQDLNTPRDPMREYYDKIGFDPAAMEHKDLVRIQNQRHQEWLTEVPNLPLNKLERKVLDQLSTYGIGNRVSSRDLKHCGPDTEERLVARGFIKAFPTEKYPDRVGFYALTDEGYAAAMAI